ncbi:MAG: hypothetical protein A2W91_06420 [Bacteroidetes bacterium GWF2_38_335]|nr:MAG: hypothetical protein A2W91_06420 [Bacteroidetes bacterium GWF2_38_335]OFY77667.1 MAG: hypothetical protein A2281_17935 [Bacteroidetes bacterium RIFOXYA12_FULL_38_20]
MAVLYCNSFTQEMSWDWSASLSSNSENYANKIAIDQQQNMFILGCFQDTLITGTDTLLSIGTQSVYIIKIGYSGNFLWSKKMSPETFSYGSLDVDADGNLYCGISFWGSLVFDETTYTGNAVLLKFSPEGDLIWTNEISSSTESTNLKKITFNNAGNIFIGGTFENDIQMDTISRTGGVMRLISYLIEMDTAGNAMGIKIIGDEDWEAMVGGLVDIEADDEGYTVLFHTTGNYDYGNGVVTPSCYGPVIVRFNNEQVCQWATYQNDFANFVDIVDFYADNSGIYLTGVYLESFSVDTCSITHPLAGLGANAAAPFVLKLNQEGHCLWLKSYIDDDELSGFGYGISADNDKNIYVMIAFNDTAVLGEDTLIGNGIISDVFGYDDILICKLDSLGVPVWAGNCGDMAGRNTGSIYTSELGDVFFVGYSIENIEIKAEIKNSFIAKKNNTYPPYPAGPVSGPTELCSNTEGNVFEISYVFNTDYYSWELPAGFAGTSDGTSIIVTVEPGAESGYIIVTPVNSNGTGEPSQIYVTVTETPEVPVVTFSDGTLYSSAASGNQWYNSEGIIEGATGDSYIPLVSDLYYVVVSNGSCSASSIDIDVTVSSPELTKNSIRIFPNPTNGIIHITNAENSRIEIRNIIGAVIMTKTISGSNNTIDLSGFAEGTYLMKITSSNKVITKKVVVSK